MSTELAVAGLGLTAAGSIIGANSKAKELRSQADQLEQQALLDRASSQRKAIEERRQADIMVSRGRAVAAAGGGGVDDPSVVNALAAIQGEGEYRALTALYEGETSATSKEQQAVANRAAARQAKTVGGIMAGGSILSGGATLLDRYGKKN